MNTWEETCRRVGAAIIVLVLMGELAAYGLLIERNRAEWAWRDVLSGSMCGGPVR